MTAEEEEAAFLSIGRDNHEQRLSDLRRTAHRGVPLARMHGRDASVGYRGLSGARKVLERSFSRDLARRAGRPLPIVPPAARCG